MGEFARRKSDGQGVKIGTGPEMYYLRWEQRHLVDQLSGSIDPGTEENLLWRLPFPDEDCYAPGEHDPYDRMEPLLQWDENGMPIFFSPPGLEPGRMTVGHKSYLARFLTLAVPCYHGDDVPALGDEAHFPRTQWAYGLRFVKNVPGCGLRPIIGCRWCGNLYRTEWGSVLPFVSDPELQTRLAAYAEVGP